jgi:hypothetical protein
MNYYRRDTKRAIELVFEDKTWIANLQTGTLADNNLNTIYSTEYNIMQTYTKQMQYFINGLKAQTLYMNNLRESLYILNTCLHG